MFHKVSAWAPPSTPLKSKLIKNFQDVDKVTKQSKLFNRNKGGKIFM